MLYLTFFETNMVIEKIDFLLAIQLRALLLLAADMQASFVRNYQATAVRYCSTLNFDINVRVRVIIYATGEMFFALAYGVMCEIDKYVSTSKARDFNCKSIFSVM